MDNPDARRVDENIQFFRLRMNPFRHFAHRRVVGHVELENAFVRNAKVVAQFVEFGLIAPGEVEVRFVLVNESRRLRTDAARGTDDEDVFIL